MRRRRRKGCFGRLLPLLIIALIGFIFYDSNTRLVVTNYELTSDKIPESLSGFKIVQLSDMHTTTYGDENSEFLSLVSGEKPDIIVITGDIIDGDKNSDEETIDNERQYVKKVITDLAKIAPVYYVTGNHEWPSPWLHELLELIADCGATVLRNQSVLISSGEDSFVLAGADDPNGPYDMMTPTELVEEIRENEGDKYIVMLYHRNDKLSLWSQLNVDTVLCGHAHGGLVRLPFTDGLVGPGGNFFPSYTSGIYEEGNTKMVASRGVGGIKLRFLNNPEIVSVELIKE
jgi:predicted MPP superfamily phosphohydrolase